MYKILNVGSLPSHLLFISNGLSRFNKAYWSGKRRVREIMICNTKHYSVVINDIEILSMTREGLKSAIENFKG